MDNQPIAQARIDKDQRGFSLLECLLVLVVMAIVILLSINRYRAYEQKLLLANIKNDVHFIIDAATRYYHEQSCQPNGALTNSSLTPTLGALGLNLPGRPPLIPLSEHAYQVTILEQKNHVHVLRITATFSSALSIKQMQWYQQILGAKYRVNHRLIWQQLPSMSMVDKNQPLSAMTAVQWRFKKIENRDKGDASPSYCLD